MKDSITANLIVFFIIAIISFAMSSAFASLTVHKENDSYKLIAIQNDSFEPHYIDEVPYIPPKPVNNTTSTNSTIIEYNYTTNNSGFNNFIETYVEWIKWV